MPNASRIHIVKARPNIRELNRVNRSIDAKGSALAGPLSVWMQHWARLEMRAVRRKLAGGKLGNAKFEKALIEKADDDAESRRRLETALVSLFRRYGMAQFNAGGRDASRTAGERWETHPDILAEMNDNLENKVVLLIEETEGQVRDSIKGVISDALRESPRPTANELGRRIARQWMGPPSSQVPMRGSVEEDRATADWRRSQQDIDEGGREHIFSFTRAQTIARTELAQARNAGTAQGFTDAGIEKVRWLAYPNDGRSGKRRHYQMNQHTPITIEDMNGKDKRKWFTLPSGIQTPHPNWIGLPAGETVNCRCNLLPVR